jgi:hypothetical protein
MAVLKKNGLRFEEFTADCSIMMYRKTGAQKLMDSNKKPDRKGPMALKPLVSRIQGIAV